VNGDERGPQDPDDWDRRQPQELDPLASEPAADDAKLFIRLAADGFAGPSYERVIEILWRYAYQVIRSWVFTGVISGKCAQKGVKGAPTAEDLRGWTADELEDLVQETLASAERKFQRNAKKGKGWQPDQRASLKSYFVTGCLFELATVYKRLRRHRDHDVNREASHPVELSDQVPDIAETVLDRLEAAELLAQLIPDSRLRLVMRLDSNGLSTAEISQILDDGTSPRAVEGMIYRYKRKTRKDSDGRQ
jgi:DNA-directed RNA polymerase specialized sigma24 family protein